MEKFSVKEAISDVKETISGVTVSLNINSTEYDFFCRLMNATHNQWECQFRKKMSLATFVTIVEALFESELLKAKELKFLFNSDHITVKKKNGYDEYLKEIAKQVFGS